MRRQRVRAKACSAAVPGVTGAGSKKGGPKATLVEKAIR
jgi:hypothetical protein